ncbi:hypothetical protein L6452_39894 [Arctium lappa]|uniref:Uncharacterized protein n=1 Tax=Arctium lappa TaxID=4217 RepID=A0ACB8XU60_ARCLA|nr:hypothetical protein L6452_39894 [Arctium lappa]
MNTYASRPVFLLLIVARRSPMPLRSDFLQPRPPPPLNHHRRHFHHNAQKPSPPRHQRHLHHEDSPAHVRSQSTRLRRPSTLIEDWKTKRCLRIGTDQNRRVSQCITEVFVDWN